MHSTIILIHLSFLFPLLLLAFIAIINNLYRGRGNYELMNPVPLMWLMFLVAVLQFLYFSISVIFQLTTHLDIHVFTIGSHPGAASPPLIIEGNILRYFLFALFETITLAALI